MATKNRRRATQRSRFKLFSKARSDSLKLLQVTKKGRSEAAPFKFLIYFISNLINLSDAGLDIKSWVYFFSRIENIVGVKDVFKFFKDVNHLLAEEFV